MELRDLVDVLETPMLMGAGNMDTTNIQSDSRRVTKRSLFVVVKGTAVDGYAYMDSTIERGVVAIVCGEAPSCPEGRCSFIVVKDSAEALGLLVSRWYGDPSGELVLVGVTGTNGRTMIVISLYETFRKTGHKVGLLPTVCDYIGGGAVPTGHTTPDSLTLHSLMARMIEAGREYASMEASSHSIDQRRINGSSFDGRVFTSLIRDHLNYHKTVGNYLKAKKKFSDDLSAGAFALTNADDKSGLVMLQNTKARELTYSLRALTGLKGKILEFHFKGTGLIANGRGAMVCFMGRFSAYSLLAMYGVTVSLGKDPEEVLIVLSMPRSVSDRFEMVQSPFGHTAIMDYAHTPDALTNVPNGIYEVLGGKGCIITVVGAGGNRGKGKCPLMAKEAAKLSDQVILTSDNPRFKEPGDIIDDMVAGPMKMDMERVLYIADRTQAIETATMLAKKGGVVLAAGKGHEDYRGIKGVRHHFDDREKSRETFSTQQS